MLYQTVEKEITYELINNACEKYDFKLYKQA
jgi:hypothetical protein